MARLEHAAIAFVLLVGFVADLRFVVPGVLGLILGSQTLMFGLFLSLLRIRVVRPRPTESAEIRPEESPLPSSSPTVAA